MDTFQALADPTRRDILELLATSGKLPASDIYSKFSVSHPAISQHLKVLRDTELVSVEKHAQQRLYQINPAKLTEIDEWLKKLAVQWEERFERLDLLLKKMKKKEVK
ncbi:metalloregulator ArsR/SmtB family transcription factor [soil metagenome]